MYNQKDIQFAGKHDYDREEAERFANSANFKTFSVFADAIMQFSGLLDKNGKRNL